MQRARVIVRYGIGVDNVDLAAARSRGIPVCNIPDYCIDEVADHTLAFILALTRQVPSHSRLVHDGEWKLAAPPAAFRTLAGMTCGVVGFGRIGRGVVRRLVAFGGRVLVSDPIASADAIAAAGAHATPLPRLLAESDLVTLHCPSLPETKGMINASTLATAKPGLLLVNLSRGDLVDPDALVAALAAPAAVGASYNLAGAVRLTAREYVAELSARSGRAVQFHGTPLRWMWLQEVGKYAVKALARRPRQWPAFRDFASRSFATELDCADAARDLGFRPEADRARFLDRAFAGIAR
jgi:hypothetical protein